MDEKGVQETNPRSRDVAAGIAILEEAGGLVTTANPPEDLDAPIPEVKLGGRSYLAIRYVSNLPSTWCDSIANITQTGR